MVPNPKNLGKPQGPSPSVAIPLTSKIIMIAIGAEQIIFNIHEDKLRKTSFFVQNGALPTPAEKLELASQNQTNPAGHRGNQPGVQPERDGFDTTKADIFVSGESKVQPEMREHTAKSPSELPDYYIVDRFFHSAEAFNIFMQYLYNNPPKSLRYRNQATELLRAYCLALRYDAFPLQNLIIQRFREYYAYTNVKFDDLVWLGNRGLLNCAMAVYLREQVAFEIAINGYEDFVRDNVYLQNLLELEHGGLTSLRIELFRAISRHAHASSRNLQDPAKGANKWLVKEKGEEAGRMREASTESL